MQSIPNRRIVRVGDLPGVDLSQGRLPDGIERGGVFFRYAIGAMRGPVRYWCRGRWGECRSEYIMTVQPGEYYPSYTQGPLDYSILFIDPDVIERAAFERGQPGRPYYSRASAEDATAHQAVIRVSMMIGAQATALERQTVFTELLDLILTRHVEKSRTIWDPVVHRAVPCATLFTTAARMI